jgi:hypothetical protein
MNHIRYRDKMQGISVSHTVHHLSLFRRLRAETVRAFADDQESIIAQSCEELSRFAFTDVETQATE